MKFSGEYLCEICNKIVINLFVKKEKKTDWNEKT